MFLSSDRNTSESSVEPPKAVKTIAWGYCFHSISCSTQPPLMFFYNLVGWELENVLRKRVSCVVCTIINNTAVSYTRYS